MHILSSFFHLMAGFNEKNTFSSIINLEKMVSFDLDWIIYICGRHPIVLLRISWSKASTILTLKSGICFSSFELFFSACITFLQMDFNHFLFKKIIYKNLNILLAFRIKIKLTYYICLLIGKIYFRKSYLIF